MAPVLEHVEIEHLPSGTAVAVFSGEHDLATRDAVRELLDGLVASHQLVVADLSRARFVDAAILGVFVDASRHASERGATFRLQLRTATIVRRACELCGLFDVVDHAPTRDAALAAKSGDW